VNISLHQILYRRNIIPYLILAFVIILLYSKTFFFGFSPLDDKILIIDNINWLSSIKNIPATFSLEFLPGLYRPILIITFLLDTFIGNGNPLYYHISNVLLHIITAFLLYLLFSNILKNNVINIFACLIFAVHPIVIHAVAWIPGRNDILLAIFLLASTISLLNHLKLNKMQSLLQHFVWFTVALFTKEISIVYPFIVIIIINKVYKSKSKAVKFIIPHLILISLWIVIRISMSSLSIPGSNNNFLNSIFLTSNHFYISISKMIFPISQSIIPYNTNVDLKYLALFLVFIIALIIFRKKITIDILPWALWVALFLIPTIIWSVFGIGDNVFYEHRLYTSTIGIIILFALFIDSCNPHQLKYVKYMYILLWTSYKKLDTQRSHAAFLFS